MASIHKRNGKYSVVYTYKDSSGVRKQKWETYRTKAEAERRKKEVEYKKQVGDLFVPSCRNVRELMNEYVNLYGKEIWSLSSYSRNESMIKNYINPLIGDVRLTEITPRFLETFYQRLQTTPAVVNPCFGHPKNEFVSSCTIKKMHQLLRSCFNQAVKWEIMEKNPAALANVPKHKEKKREIWDADTLIKALDSCKDERLKLALNLTFSCTLRLGELLGLTWDCVDISDEAIENNNSFIYINKELQRVKKTALQALNEKDVLVIFPETSKRNTSIRVLKTPKTESSVRKVFLPPTVAYMLREWKERQDEMIELLGSEYKNYDLVLASEFGLPTSGEVIRKALSKLIEENDLKPVVFHSLRHTSVTYKLKLNGGDIKAVQGDSGHSQVKMVTDIYSHIIDDDRKKNAELFEAAFYQSRKPDAERPEDPSGADMIAVPEGVDPDLLAKVLANPEMMALIGSMAKALK